jgi:predicted homoserine dehydrogenase-like protein
VRPAIYAHLEAMRSIRALVREGKVLLDNSARPRFSVGAVAKRDLQPGHRMPFGIGSFDVRGHIVRIADAPAHLPIGLIKDATVARPLERGDLLAFDDLDLPAGLAVEAWRNIRRAATH